jgi:hypothetical protein
VGTYTSTFGFYKPDASEFVDPNVHLNRNWDIADSAVKRLLDYEYTSVQFPDMSQAKTSRAKFYRPYSNSVVQYRKATNSWYQDPAAFVSPWTHLSGAFVEGYFEQDLIPIYYRIIKKAGGTTAEVEWCGAIWELGGAMELNANAQPIGPGSIPAAICPAVSKYWNVWAGNTTNDFSVARILIGNDGRMEFKRYGVNPGAGSMENRVELTGIRYNVEVTGT